MKSNRLVIAVAGVLAFLTVVTPAEAGWLFHRHNARGVRFLRGIQATTTTTVTVIPPVYAAPQCGPAGCPRPALPAAPAKILPAPQSFVPAPVQYQQTPKPVAMGDDAATFLVLINDARARIGRPAVVWDATLAAFAAQNYATHAPGSSGGAAQVWAGTRSYRHAFGMWANSPSHWTILMNATTSVGGSYSATGITVNAR